MSGIQQCREGSHLFHSVPPTRRGGSAADRRETNRAPNRGKARSLRQLRFMLAPPCSGPWVRRLEILLHPVIDELDTPADDHLFVKQPIAVPLEERTGRDTRLREYAAVPLLPRLGFQRRQKNSPDPGRLMIGVDVEMVKMAIAFQVAEADDLISPRRHEAEPARQFVRPTLLIHLVRSPGADLLRRVVADVDAPDCIPKERDDGWDILQAKPTHDYHAQ